MFLARIQLGGTETFNILTNSRPFILVQVISRDEAGHEDGLHIQDFAASACQNGTRCDMALLGRPCLKQTDTCNVYVLACI